MAEGKKSFVIYTSWKRWLDGLNLEQKGKWLDWMLSYTNDEHPDFPQDQAVMIACMMAQDTLKRDLQKYEDRRNRLLRNGKQYQTNVDSKKENEIDIEPKSNRSRTEVGGVNVNVNVNDNVNDISNDIDKKKVKEKTSAEVTHSYGEYKRIKLKDSQYKKLVDEFGENKTQLAITKLDEYVQSNNNKNKYKDFYLVLRKVIKEDWFHISKDVQNQSNDELEELIKIGREYPREERYEILRWKCSDENLLQKALQILDNEIVFEEA